MRTSVVRLVVTSLALAFALTIAVFELLQQSPGGLIGTYANPDAPAADSTTAMRAIGPFKPVFVQYVGWLGLLVRGDLGWSASNHEPVAQVIGERLPATVELVACAFVAAILLGAFGGTLRLRANGTMLGRFFAVLELIGRSVPIPLIVPLAVMLGLFVPGFPTAGIASGDTFDLVDRLRHLVLPVLTLALPLGAWASCVFYETRRASDGAERARGEARWVNFVRASAACVSMLAPVIISVSLFVEGVFALPGAVRLFSLAVSQGDAALITGLVIVYGLGVIALKLIAQLLLVVVGDRGARPEAALGSRATRAAFFSKPVAVAGLVLVCVLGILGFAGVFVAPEGPNYIDQVHWRGYPLAPGVGGHLLGTDENGIDLLGRLLFALRTSLSIAVGASLVATAFGLAIAAIGGRLRGAAAASVSEAGTGALSGIRAFGTLPFILLVVALALGRPMNPLLEILVIGVASWPAIVAAVRAPLSLRLIGGAAVSVAGAALLLESTLSNHGFSVPRPTPTLGNLLANSQSNITVAPWIVAVPLLVVMVALFALYAISDGLREA